MHFIIHIIHLRIEPLTYIFTKYYILLRHFLIKLQGITMSYYAIEQLLVISVYR